MTSASVHDSQALADLVDDSDNVVFADSAYAGADLHRRVLECFRNTALRIHERGNRGKPLSEAQRALNAEKSKIRCRVEHVFGHIHKSMGGLFVRCIGIVRATAEITLNNLAYNLCRYAHIVSNRARLTTPC